MSLFLLAALSLSPAGGAPPIRVWLSTPSSDIYVHTGDPVRVLFRSGEDGYVLIVRINAAGKVQMLFPGDPVDTAPVPGGGTYEVLGRGQPESFVVEESDGSGYVLGAWSSHPFQLGRFARKEAAGGWDYSAIDAALERVSHQAPRSVLVHLAQAIAEDSSFEYDLTAYTVANQPVVVAETPPPYQDERLPQQDQSPEAGSPAPMLNSYPYAVEYYQPAPFQGGGHRHRRAFVPCQWQCYPGSPNTLVGYGKGTLGGSTGTGLIIGHGDRASYVAVPQKPKPQVVTAAVAATRPVGVPSRALVAAERERRADEKITFGPVTSIRSRVLVAGPAAMRTPAPAALVQTRAMTVPAAAVRVLPSRLPTVAQPQGYATVPQSAGAVTYTSVPMLQPAMMPSALRLGGSRTMGTAGLAISGGAASGSAGGAGTRAYVGPAAPVVVRAR